MTRPDPIGAIPRRPHLRRRPFLGLAGRPVLGRRLVGLVVVAATVLGPFAGWAGRDLGGRRAEAAESSVEEIATLAARAIVELSGDSVADSAALDELRRVDAVAGRSVDLAAALDVSDVDVLVERLRHLSFALAGVTDEMTSETATDPAVDVSGAAAGILEGDRYHDREGFRPFRSVIERVREALGSDDGGDDADRVAGTDGTGGGSDFGMVVAIVVIGALAVVVVALVRRRVRSGVDDDSPEGRARATALRADHLERDANRAREQGAHDRAVRLRFQAGLLRLESVGALDLEPGLTNRTAADCLGSPDFDELARAFDAIVYGHRPANPGDVDRAWLLWPTLVEAERLGARAHRQAMAGPARETDLVGETRPTAMAAATAAVATAAPIAASPTATSATTAAAPTEAATGIDRSEP